MIQIIGNILYNILPKFILKWRTKSEEKINHIYYCQKIAILLLLIILYNIIVIIFVYYQWLKCTNIIHLINNKYNENINKTKLFYRKDDFCNITDWFFIIYLVFLIFTLGLNVIFGIFYNYYRKYKNNILNKDNTLYNDKVIIHIPLYNENEDVIKKTIDSIKDLNYNLDNILLMIVLDGIIINKKSNKNIDEVLLKSILQNSEYINNLETNNLYNNTIKYKDNNLKLYNGLYHNINYIVIIKCGNNNEINNPKRGNRGKKDSALIIYETINFINNEYFKKEYNNTYTNIINYIQHSITFKEHSINEYNYILILDCDTEIEKNSLLSLLSYLKNNTDCIAVCGQTVVKNKYESFITIIQCFEYFISHLLLKTFEHIMYNVFVLSGCFTLIKLTNNNKTVINKNIIKKYIEIDGNNSLYEKNLLDIGEDRYLTSLILQEFPDKNLSYISDALCYTDVPNTFKILIDQRRRWTNSLISCLFLLILQPPKQSLFQHLKMYLIIIMELFIIFVLPLVIIIGLFNSILSITLQGYSFVPLFITIFIIFLNLIIIIIVGKFDMILKFVPFFTFLPIFSIIIPLYSILNLDNLKWGLTRDTEEVNDNIDTNNQIYDSYIDTPNATPITEERVSYVF